MFTNILPQIYPYSRDNMLLQNTGEAGNKISRKIISCGKAVPVTGLGGL
jgi:hypothetical protein